jgi:hypothetical protein
MKRFIFGFALFGAIDSVLATTGKAKFVLCLAVAARCL